MTLIAYDNYYTKIILLHYKSNNMSHTVYSYICSFVNLYLPFTQYLLLILKQPDLVHGVIKQNFLLITL